MGGLATGRRPHLLLGAGALACALLALAPGEAGPLAARAGLAALAVSAVAALAGRRRQARPAPSLRITAQAALGRASAVALVEVDGRRFLVGAGGSSLELLAELAPTATVDGAP
jgi:flagellar biosynthesis protein FliO